MRITNSMMTSKFLSEANKALNRVDKYQSQVNSTKRMSSIADDPQSTLLALKARNKLSNLDLYQSNIATASSYLKEAESATSALNQLLQSAYDDIISAQSAKTPEDLMILAEDLKNLQDEVLSISNSSLGTSYIFGGYNFTGSIVGDEKMPPFKVEENTGDLIYNGINISQIAWKDDYDTAAGQMENLSHAFYEITASYPASSINEYAKEQAQDAADTLGRLVKNGKKALEAAREYGVSPLPTTPTPDQTAAYNAYTALETFVGGISTIADTLNNETSKALAGDYILDTNPAIEKNGDGSINYDYYQERGISVYTLDELDNKFGVYVDPGTHAVSTNVVNGIMTGAVGYLGTVSAPPAVFTPGILTTRTADLSAAMLPLLNPVDAETRLDTETQNRMQLQIGTSQTVEATLTGIDLLGEGSSNLYHLLGKAISTLQGESDPDALSRMITSLQKAQSNVLTLGTKIGATMNRMTLMNSRYDNSKLNYTEMRSNAEDVDMAEAIINLTEAQTVYNAALAGGAEILRTSLIDFLR